MPEEVKGAMQQPSQPNYNEIIMRQLERLEQRFEERFSTLEQRMRSDLDGLRKDLVARDAFDPQMNALKTQVIRVDTDRIADRAAMENRIDKLEREQISRQDRFGIRVSQAVAIAGFALALFEFMTHLKFSP